ncbi:FecCD family ABC transporter permease [Zhihengliuella salsuginis]|uniref:Iron ABC transporter permease n=1 Tax=Zhihengliuella salsuginis TaxID=578222 RepID=A0ABQ3GCF2_9MICC|nr:iron ABC transporter permease [Zhihengliuella salsuginis]GHD00286.1 iron ABC transporter permease [Zhihengliuella salsuginis]
MKISALAPASRDVPKPAASRSSPAVRARTLAILAAVVVIGVVLSIGVGSARSTPGEIWHAFADYTGTVMDLTVREIRVPRTLTALAVGAALGVAGTLVQGHTRNPIAEPGLLGINHGAALAIVATTAAAGPLSYSAQALLAFTGALVASVVVFGIGSVDRRGGSPTTLVLVGAAVTSLCLGLVSATVLLSEAALETLRFWQVGSVAGRSGALELLWPVLLLGGLLAWLNATQLNALALGEAAATGLGVTTARARGVGLAALVLLAGAAVTIAGPVAFVGLLVPHVARWALGADYRWLVPASALIGSAIILLADTLGRIIARPGELPVGVVVALAGAPVFVYIARRKRVVSA